MGPSRLLPSQLLNFSQDPLALLWPESPSKALWGLYKSQKEGASLSRCSPMPGFPYPLTPSVGCPCAVNTLHNGPCPVPLLSSPIWVPLYPCSSPRVPGRGTLSPASFASFPRPTRHPSCVRMIHGAKAVERTMPKFVNLLEFSTLTLGLWIQTPALKKHLSPY